MPRIVLVGAGSVEFTRNLLGDILTSPALRSSQIALHDIDPERLATAERMARWTADCARCRADDLRPSGPARGARGRRLRRQHDPGRRRARDPGRLRRPGEVRAALHDRRHHRRRRRVPRPAHDPRRARDRPRHGGDLSGRLAPQLHEPARDPGPGGVGGDVDPGRRAVPLGLLDDRPARRATSGCARDEIDAAIGRAQPPRLRPPPRASRPGPLSRAARVRRGRQDTGRRPRPGGRSSGGSASTRPNRPSTTPNTTRGTSASATPPATRSSGSTSRSASTSTASRTTSTSTPRRSGCSTPGEAFEIERSGEYAATIAEAMTTGAPARIVVNAMNRGALIPNLEADACVEVPGLVDGLGVHPVAMGAPAAPPRRLRPRRRRHAGPDGARRARARPRRRSATRS